MSGRRLALGVLPSLVLGCLMQGRPLPGLVWAWNLRCRPVDVIADYRTGRAHRTYRLAYGQGADLPIGEPTGGGCSPKYALPAEFHGLVVRDDTGRTVLVDPGQLRELRNGVWQVDIDEAILSKSPEVDGGAYFSPDAVATPGAKDVLPEERGHAWQHCEGPPP
jgi:hypothetical protein